MTDPITDDDLQEIRESIADYVHHKDQLKHLQVSGSLVAGIIARLDAAELRVVQLERACSETENTVSQILGKSLGFPWFKDDPSNFPDATEEHGVCTGEYVAEDMANLAATRVAELEREVERLSSMEGSVATLKAVVREKTPGKCRLLSEGERCDCHLCRLDWIQFTLSGK